MLIGNYNQIANVILPFGWRDLSLWIKRDAVHISSFWLLCLPWGEGSCNLSVITCVNTEPVSLELQNGDVLLELLVEQMAKRWKGTKSPPWQLPQRQAKSWRKQAHSRCRALCCALGHSSQAASRNRGTPNSSTSGWGRNSSSFCLRGEPASEIQKNLSESPLKSLHATVKETPKHMLLVLKKFHLQLPFVYFV